MEQARELATKIKKLRLTNLYSSPLLRAVQTANIITQHCFFPQIFTVVPGLHECCFGQAEGMVIEDSKAKFGENLVHDFLFPTKETWDLRFAGGESKHQVFNRVINTLDDVLNDVSGYSNVQNRIGIVCHAGVLSALQCGLGLKDVSYENCSILHLSCEGYMYMFEARQLKQVFD